MELLRSSRLKAVASLTKSVLLMLSLTLFLLPLTFSSVIVFLSEYCVCSHNDCDHAIAVVHSGTVSNMSGLHS